MTARRMAAELIPKYAPNCPGALQAAVHILKQLCQWSAAELRQRREPQGSGSEGAANPKESTAGVGTRNGEHSQGAPASELSILAGAASSAFSGLAALLSLAATFATSAATGKLSTLPVVVPMRPGVPPTANHYANVARDAASFLLSNLQPAVNSEPGTGAGTGAGAGGLQGLPVADLERPAKRARTSADGGEQKRVEDSKGSVITEQSSPLKGGPSDPLFDTLTQQHVTHMLPAIVGSAIVSAIAEQPEVLLGVAMEAARGKDPGRKKLGQHLILQVSKGRPQRFDGEAGSIKEEPVRTKGGVKKEEPDEAKGTRVKKEEPSGEMGSVKLEEPSCATGSIKKEEPDAAKGSTNKEGQQNQQNAIQTCLAFQVRGVGRS